uniref:UPL7 n=1 Tax=Arundo donax TaxID=35708 RepID=A0A0A9HP07_ARUDO
MPSAQILGLSSRRGISGLFFSPFAMAWFAVNRGILFGCLKFRKCILLIRNNSLFERNTPIYW